MVEGFFYVQKLIGLKGGHAHEEPAHQGGLRGAAAAATTELTTRAFPL